MTQQVNPTSNNEQDDAGEQLTPEVRERVERLVRDLNQAPATTCPFTFNWQGDRVLVDRASNKIRLYGLMMREDWSSMSFESLKAITFHHDYEQALKDAAGADRSAPAPTKEAGGFSVGIMVRVSNGVHLVMHESVALALASDEREQSDCAQHVVRHELCHVADFAFKQELIAKQPDRCTYSGFDSMMAPLAEACGTSSMPTRTRPARGPTRAPFLTCCATLFQPFTQRLSTPSWTIEALLTWKNCSPSLHRK